MFSLVLEIPEQLINYLGDKDYNVITEIITVKEVFYQVSIGQFIAERMEMNNAIVIVAPYSTNFRVVFRINESTFNYLKHSWGLTEIKSRTKIVGFEDEIFELLLFKS